MICITFTRINTTKKINSLDTKNKKNKNKKKQMNEISKYIAEEETDINEELFKRHFNFQRPSDIFNSLNNINDIEKNNKLVNVISSGLKDLKK